MYKLKEDRQMEMLFTEGWDATEQINYTAQTNVSWYLDKTTIGGI